MTQGEPRPRHQRATLLTLTEGRGVGYVLDGVAYGVVWPPPRWPTLEEARQVALRHAAHLELLELTAGGSAQRARQAAQLALALCRLAEGHALTETELQTVRQEHGAPTGEAVLHADGSADKQGGRLSVGYTLNGRPYQTFFLHERGHEHLAEREAIRLALTHAWLLGYARFRVRSDHRFHVRRYAEHLVHRGRRKSTSLERLDALVEALGSAVHFEYLDTQATDAPHRLAVHARALHRLALGEPLTRAQEVALRRVHFALKAGGAAPY
ncbi:hypothetical protein [Deinococcus sp. YIM 77859]|uniref:hypothetical protein n=1 Tax=Deinococcus sp. YIM 77859 TaxID=1540221 RepID=UPI0012E08A41|nr:hypothetical protein [Deinococcus sp. YIM 77859]